MRLYSSATNGAQHLGPSSWFDFDVMNENFFFTISVSLFRYNKTKQETKIDWSLRTYAHPSIRVLVKV